MRPIPDLTAQLSVDRLQATKQNHLQLVFPSHCIASRYQCVAG
ncbi:hypothetical protein SALWKB12_0739 [Snodgrassella communis]|nr:hypothetical protein SALWKB12_0739 [Snodgrassella communis]